MRKSLIFWLVFPLYANNSITLSAGQSVLVNETRVYCEQGRGVSPGQLLDEVDLECMDARLKAYPYSPGLETLLGWTLECRSEVDEAACSKLATRAAVACERWMVKAYPYSPSDETLTKFNAVCRTQIFKCSP